MNTCTMTCLLLSVIMLAGQALAADWPQFHGQNGSGIAADASVPTVWSDTTNLQWKTALPGPGSSSPIVSGDRVFVTCYSGYGDGSTGATIEKLKRHLVCLDRSTGKILWDKAVPTDLPEDSYNGYISEHGYASSTPVTDGKCVYVFFGKSGVLAFDFAGKQLWKTSVGKQSSNRRWGSAASPVLFGNLVIVNAAEENRAVYALDTATGKEVWKAPSDNAELSYSTPAIVNCGNGRTNVMVAVPRQVWALNPDTGKTRWYVNTSIGGNLSPSVIAGKDMVFVTGGFPQQGTVALRDGGKGNMTESNIVWSSEVASYVPTPLVHGGNLYFVSDLGLAVCLDAATGKEVHRERLPDAGRSGKPVYASTVMAGNHLYAVTRRKGTFVLDATPQMKVIAQNTFTGDDTDFNATPAISGKQLFLRSNRYLYCVAIGR